MNPRYIPKTLPAMLGWLVEEMGEVQAAVGKTIRFGVASTNPDSRDKEMNGDWVLRELRDVEAAIKLVRKALAVEMEATDGDERALP